jgi:transcription elongation factor GreB
MSKAFTSETGDEEDGFVPPPLPPGTRNYMTPAGAQRMKAECESLLSERKSIPNSDFEGKRRLSAIERRLLFLTQRLDSVQIVDPAAQPPDQVRFGATVELEESGGSKQRWRIVGIDEADLDRGQISWISPLAAALLGAKGGDIVLFQKQRLKVASIRYEET